MSSKDREIPEDVFRKDFGGSRFEAERSTRLEGSQRQLLLGGLLVLLTLPAVLAAIAGGVTLFYYCRKGIGCM